MYALAKHESEIELWQKELFRNDGLGSNIILVITAKLLIACGISIAWIRGHWSPLLPAHWLLYYTHHLACPMERILLKSSPGTALGHNKRTVPCAQ
eukprot:3200481-Amphidinium_carterae.1